MGCIVNGPGEMADADFGYVGGAPGKIDLYVGKEVVQRGIPMEGVSGWLLSMRAFGEPSALVQCILLWISWLLMLRGTCLLGADVTCYSV